MWFRQDLRIHDNPALVDAAKWAQRRGGSVVCVYVHSPEKDGDAVGAGSRCERGSQLLGVCVSPVAGFLVAEQACACACLTDTTRLQAGHA